MDLAARLQRTDLPIDDIAQYLDGLSPEARVAELFALDRGGQRSLYERCATAPALTLEHFVPADRPVLTAVRHRGRNTLPLPGKHRFFEKRFCRPDDGSARLFGYNEAPSRGLVGPGYFVAVSTVEHPAWLSRGGVVVDYFRVPDSAVVPGWPPVKANHQGLQFFVYHHTRDFLRRVSAHVSIGAAYKVERALDHYFVLCRED